MQYEKDKVYNMSNNDAVKLFYELVSVIQQDYSLRGRYKSDTIVNVFLLVYIRKANILMIERNYLLDITEEQDSIICLNFIYEQDSINTKI